MPITAFALNCSLKPSGADEKSSTDKMLCDVLDALRKHGVTASGPVRAADRNIKPGVMSDMGEGDEWPGILEKVLASEIVILATPVWWGNQSSAIQRVIERLDELHDKVLAGEGSGLEGKAGGIVITGDSDGAQQVIGNLCNFFNAIGLLIPPYATLSVLWERQAKSADPSKEELLRKYEADYSSTADRMIDQLLAHASSDRRGS